MTKAIKASTQEHLDIYAIKDDLVILKDGSCALILQTTAINFDLLSEDEQGAIMYSYAGLLNSLSFVIQILIRSQHKDISTYLELLDNRIQQTPSQKVKESVIRYRRFVKSLVKEKRVLEKHFYIIIPLTTIELGITASTFNPFAKRPDKPPFDLDYIIEKAQIVLSPRRDHLIHQFTRLGLQAHQLTTSELTTLFHNTYNPQALQNITSPDKDQPSEPEIVTQKPTAKSPSKILRSIFNRRSKGRQVISPPIKPAPSQPLPPPALHQNPPLINLPLAKTAPPPPLPRLQTGPASPPAGPPSQPGPSNI